MAKKKNAGCFLIEIKNNSNLLDIVESWKNNDSQSTFSPTGAFHSFEGTLHSLNGNEQAFSIQVGETIWEGKPSLIMIINDVTRIKLNYQELSKHKDQLLATVSHDLRTPLNGILGLVECLIEEINILWIKEKLLIVQISARLLLSMINDILDFSMINEGKLRLNKHFFNVKALVLETIKMIEIQAKLKELKITFDCQLQNEIIFSDANRLRQVLLNLIGNAIRFTEVGKISVRVREETHVKFIKESLSSKTLFSLPNEDETSQRNNSDLRLMEIFDVEKPRKILFEVEDTGIGIPKEKLKNLFKLFGKLEYQNKDINQCGIGLGLAISQSLVRKLNENTTGEKIRVKSDPGRGSRFFFCILSPDIAEIEGDIAIEHKKSQGGVIHKFSKSFKSMTNCKENSTKNSGNELNGSSRGSLNYESLSNFESTSLLRVLAVDDDPINLVVISNYLSKPSSKYLFKLKTAHNGLQALNLVRSKAEKFDLILMDCNMPVLDGYQASIKIRKLMNSGEVNRMPIIAVSANAANLDKELCFKCGMDSFLTKPLRRVDLIDEIEKQMREVLYSEKKYFK